MQRAALAILILCGLCAAGCAQIVQRRLLPPAQAGALDRRSPYLKVHARDRTLYVLSEWSVDAEARTVSGAGRLYDVGRKVTGEGRFSVPLDSVALFETNVTGIHPAVAALAVMTVASVALTIYCATNPKSCFGSCPTFYVWDGERWALQAEGFSSSVTPALEATDLDALYHARPSGRDLEVRMRNEALETHVVRSVDLLVAPRPEEGRVFATAAGEFWQAPELIELERASAPEGDCTEALRACDGVERWSAADSTDLAAREVLEIRFPSAPAGSPGLVIASRQTLLTTYLFYQTLAWMGRRAGDFIAVLERLDPATRSGADRIGRALGGIEVLVRGGEGDWVRAGEIRETGPLATDVKLVRLPPLPPGPVDVRLRMTRGHWRLDYVALVGLGDRVEARRLTPACVMREGAPDEEARASLLDPERVLVTTRGDEYTLVYRLPEDFKGYELFLESRGYYLEWMREEWLGEEDPTQAIKMLLNPRQVLRELAPQYTRGEAEREAVFWASRYARP